MSQFRRLNHRSLLSRILGFFYSRKVGFCGPEVNFDSIVHLMRFPKQITLQKGVYVKFGARLCPCRSDSEIHIGENTTIGYDTKVFASGRITIGDNCMIAPNVYIVDSDHGIAREKLMNTQDNVITNVTIGNDVWIGTGAVILKGAEVADGCVIAANSVVKGVLEPYSIYAGVPAKKIGERN